MGGLKKIETAKDGEIKKEDGKQSECYEEQRILIHICFCILNAYPRISIAKCKMCQPIDAIIIKHNHWSYPN